VTEFPLTLTTVPGAATARTADASKTRMGERSFFIVNKYGTFHAELNASSF
jgi:hypothetical protein